MTEQQNHFNLPIVVVATGNFRVLVTRTPHIPHASSKRLYGYITIKE